MIHFFRRIRQKLLANSQMKKYIVYALGEILLVVIGILIALQINNWNEQRKTRNSEKEALHNLYNEFVNNQIKFHEHITPKKAIRDKWKIFLKRLGDESLSEDEQPKMRNLPPGSSTLNVSFGILQSLINSGKIEIIRNDTLKNQLANWSSVFEEFEEEEQVHWEINRHYFNKFDKLPNPFFEGAYDGKPKWLFHNQEEHIALYKIAFKDIGYQNLMINNYQALQSTLSDAEPVDKGFDVIVSLLEKEIAKFE